MRILGKNNLLSLTSYNNKVVSDKTLKEKLISSPVDTVPLGNKQNKLQRETFTGLPLAFHVLLNKLVHPLTNMNPIEI